MALFDISHMSSYLSSIVTMAVSYIVSLLVHNNPPPREKQFQLEVNMHHLRGNAMPEGSVQYP